MTPTSAPPTDAKGATAARSSVDALAAAHAAIDADPRPGIWIDLVDRDLARRRAEQVDAAVRSGADLPLAGLTLAVKGNIDVGGLATTAGCPAYARTATHDAPVVRALTEAGAVVVGTTNMDQFATGLVGTRSPYGVCPNAHWPGLISGGSSSGSAVAVAAGMVDLALGTDTAGSGRVPAAANGIVGLKPTRGRLSLSGVVPACASLDCVSVFARDVQLAHLAIRIAQRADAGPDDAPDPWRRAPVERRPTAVPRVAVPPHAALGFDGDEAAAERHGHAVATLVETLGDHAQVVELDPADLEHLVATGRLLYDGAFVAERYAAVGEFVDAHRDQVDPTVGGIISAAGRLPAWRLAADLERLARARRRSEQIFAELDAVVLPTVPRLPTVEQVHAAPIEVNSMLGTYTNFVNLLDLAAVTVPVDSSAARSTAPPHSVSLIGPAWSEATLVSLAARLPGGPASRLSR